MFGPDGTRFGVALDPLLPGTANGSLASFRCLELVLDSTERERSGLAIRRMRRLLAPATQENPIFMHLTVDPNDVAAVEGGLDQMTAVGFEMALCARPNRTADLCHHRARSVT